MIKSPLNSFIWLFVIIFFVGFIFSPISLAQSQNTSDINSLQNVFNLLYSLGTPIDGITTPNSVLAPTTGLITPSSSAPASSTVDDLVNKIRINCNYGAKGVVNRNTEFCLNNLQLDPTIAYQLKPSTNCIGTDCSDYLQCVRFVKAAVMTTGGIFDTYGNARDYMSPSKWPTGYRFISKTVQPLKSGDLPIWDIGTYGHIAYVTEVLGNNYFAVAEANFDKPGHVRIYKKSIDDPLLVGWLTKQ